MARRVYVGNLSWRTSWQDLKDHFKEAGNVVYADVLREPGSDRSKGCGIVEFETPEEAARAIRDLHNTVIDGRQVFVREDREDKELQTYLKSDPAAAAERERRAPPRRAPRAAPQPREHAAPEGEEGAPGRRVFVQNLPFECTWQELKEHMCVAGNVIHADVLRGHDGRSRGCGIVEYETAEEAANAIATMDRSELNGRPVLVREDREDKPARSAPAPRAPRGGNVGGYQGGELVEGAKGRQIVVHGLAWAVEWHQLKDLMAQAGPVVRADVVKDSSGRSRGYGIVVYETEEAALNAIEMFNGVEFEGRSLGVKLDAKL